MEPEQIIEELSRAYHALQEIENLQAEEPDDDHSDAMFKIANNTLKLLDAAGIDALIRGAG